MTTNELLFSALVIIIEGSLGKLDSIFMLCKFFSVEVVESLTFFGCYKGHL